MANYSLAILDLLRIYDEQTRASSRRARSARLSAMIIGIALLGVGAIGLGISFGNSIEFEPLKSIFLTLMPIGVAVLGYRIGSGAEAERQLQARAQALGALQGVLANAALSDNEMNLAHDYLSKIEEHISMRP